MLSYLIKKGVHTHCFGCHVKNCHWAHCSRWLVTSATGALWVEDAGCALKNLCEIIEGFVILTGTARTSIFSNFMNCTHHSSQLLPANTYAIFGFNAEGNDHQASTEEKEAGLVG